MNNSSHCRRCAQALLHLMMFDTLTFPSAGSQPAAGLSWGVASPALGNVNALDQA